MKLEGDYLFEASVPEVWSALFDPVILAAVMPGCEKLELVEGQFVGEIKVKVGPIQGKFTGKVELKDKDEPHGYTMIVDGRGAPGFVKATAHVRLAAEGEGTRVTYDTDAQIGGKIASVGQRLIDASARAIVAQSLEGLAANIKLRAAAYREAAASQAAAAPDSAAASEAASEGRGPEAPDAAASEAPGEPAGPAAATAASGPASPAAAAAASDPGSPAAATAASGPASPAAVAAAPAPASAAAPRKAPDAAPAPVAFTPIKVTQAAVANAVAKEVASTLFPRSVLVGIIMIQAAVIAWLLLM